LVDHLILSEDFACELFRREERAAAPARFGARNREVVIVTRGVNGCVYLASDDSSPNAYRHSRVRPSQPPAAAMSFHGAYALALARNLHFAGADSLSPPQPRV